MKKNYGEYFNLAHKEQDSLIYGPGKRFVVWFQGCALACKGCWNRQMWSFKENQLVHRENLLTELLSTPNIKGITLLGGEPLHQANNLFWLLKEIRNKSALTIFLFTGYEQSELKALGYASTIFKLCDMVALGRYDENLRNTNQQWIGSTNQQIIYPKHSRESQQPQRINQVEIIIDDNGKLTTLGFPDEKLSK